MYDHVILIECYTESIIKVQAMHAAGCCKKTKLGTSGFRAGLAKDCCSVLLPKED